MITTSFELARQAGACQESYRKYAKHIGGIKKFGESTPIDVVDVLDVLGLRDTLWVLSCAVPQAQREGVNKLLRLFSCECAEHTLKNYENWEPDDTRVRDSINVARRYIDGDATLKELRSAESAARSAARWAESAWSAAESAARWAAESAAESAVRWAGSAAWSAESAAESAARWAESAWLAAESAESAAGSAARSAARWAAWSAGSAARWAAWSAARSAAESAESAARLAEKEWQIQKLRQLLSQ